VVGQATPDELTAVGRLRNRFGSVTIVQVDHGRSRPAADGAAGARSGAASAAGVPILRFPPGTPFVQVWDPHLARQGARGSSGTAPAGVGIRPGAGSGTGGGDAANRLAAPGTGGRPAGNGAPPAAAGPGRVRR
jgi:hypothetical protein